MDRDDVLVRARPGQPATTSSPSAPATTANLEVVGYAGLCCYDGEAYIQTIGVIPEAQGTGIGSMLLTALLEEAVRRDEDVVTLEVRADNPTGAGDLRAVRLPADRRRAGATTSRPAPTPS